MSPILDVPMSIASNGSTTSECISSTPSDEELAWLRRCLPIFVQPDVDIKNHNGLVKIFFRFMHDDQSDHLVCKLCIVFAGESSYNRVYEETENTLATLCYRTFNRRTYKRTADINYMEFRYVCTVLLFLFRLTFRVHHVVMHDMQKRRLESQCYCAVGHNLFAGLWR